METAWDTGVGAAITFVVSGALTYWCIVTQLRKRWQIEVRQRREEDPPNS
ncbi:hypothetical protein Acor_76990 [Acrocarpospora corrugata]|uniref:Uncharacterized protein n=1 Tax=Acrocarpospora corrugata TaxID=35763 RepID=A0A5M3WEX9_9ACTN|nr:hypothetical protein Acor_76990 [Acrocarpospora corrugata]